MLSNSQIKHINSLKLKKYRDEFQEFIAEGSTLVADLINSRLEIRGVYALNQWITANTDLLERNMIAVFEAGPAEMQRISALSSPGPVLAIVKIPSDAGIVLEETDADTLEQIVPGIYNELSLMLEGISDPGNFGTILRIADWFGIRNVFCSENCVEVYNPKVVQASMGSVARVKVFYTDTGALLSKLAGRIPVYGTFMEGESIYSSTLKNKGIIIIGSETRGISYTVAGYVSNRLFIPSYGSLDYGKAESLNAAVAAAIVIAEFRRPSAI